MKRFFKTMAFTLLGLVLSMNVMAETYTKVTSVSEGTYLIVYEVSATSGRAFNGVDAANGYETCTISNGTITSTELGAYEVTIAAMTGGYSLQLSASLGTDNKSKYIYGKSGNNSIQFGATAVANEITFSDGAATILSNSTSFRYNSQSGNDRFRYFKTTTTGNNYILPALYKKESGTPPAELVAPSITTQPKGASYEKDATATALTVAASGNPTPTYQWYSNTSNSTLGASAISGETNASYTPSTASIGTKYYYCVASNSEGSATSDIVAVTVTAGFEGKKLTFDLSTNNLNLPTAKSSSVAGDYTYTLDDVNYTFSVTDAQGSSDGGVYFSSSYTMVYASNAIGLPAISGYKLVKVEASNSSGCSTSVQVAIKDGPTADDNDVTGGTAKTWSTTSSTYTYNLSGTDENTMYYLYVSNKNAQITGLTLYYQELAPTSSAVTFTAPEGGSLVIKNDATPITSGATIQDGTVLGVEFGMTPAEAYKDVAIKVTNTTTSADVTSTVYNSETQKITMPRYPITVAVTFTKLYKISLVKAGEGTGTATMNGVTTDIYVDGDTQIDLVASAVAPNEFTKWSATSNISIDAENDAETYAYAFGDGTITATFGVSALLPLDAPTLSAPTNITYNSVTLNWQELANAEGGYNVEILLNDETVAFDLGYGENYWTSDPILQANTTYTYTVQGVGDGSTYAEENNPKATSTFTTADYPAATLTLSENGETSELVGKLNTPITLPTESTQACDGKVFMGWSATEIDGEVDAEPSLLGETYTFTDPAVLEKTIYAVYAKKVEGDKYFEKVSSAPADWCGKYLIVYETGNLAMNGSLTTLDAVSNIEAVTISNNKIAWSAEMEAIAFTVAYKTGSSTVYSLKSASGKYISGTTTSATASNGIKQADTDANYEISFDGLTLQSKSSDQQMVLKYNDAKDQTRFRFYKSGQKDIALYKYSATIDYSNYCTTCEAAVAAPTFSLAEGEYDEAKTLTLSAAEGDIYYTINDGEETKYTAAIALNNRGTYEISAYAKVDDRTSETVTKTYTLDWAYTLDELAASDVASGTSVQVTFENKEITGFYTNGQGKRYGIYVNVQKGGKDVEIYCNKAEHSNTWEVGGKVSSAQAISGTWTYYSGGSQWEFCPSNWDNISYTPPAKITDLVIDGDLINKNYTAGQKLDFTGLTVTGVYSDNTDQNPHTEDVTESVVWTEVTLTQDQTEATATATLNDVRTDNKNVSENKTITGLTVGAAKTLESIYVDNEHSTHKTAFFVGRPFSAEGLKVMARYNMGDDQQIALANLTIDNPTFSAAEAEHTINISYTENEVEKSTSYKVSVGYMNLSDLVAEDIPTNTSVKVAFSNVEITGFYKNKNEQRTGVYVNVKGKNDKNIELYYNTPSTDLDAWQEGGLLATKNAYISGTWSYYENGEVWEITFASGWDWDTNLDYTAPEIYPTAIELNETTAKVKQSKSLDLEASFTPTNATVLNNLEWSSDNNQVIVVPSQDKKSATVTVAPDATVGTATITVKVDDKDGQKLSATCVITIEEYSVPHYGLYTGDITEGDYIFKADGEYYYMNNTNNNGRLANVANENNPEIVNNIITTDAETYVWQIAKSGDYWTIKNLATKTYVVSTASGKASLSDSPSDNTEKWTITYDETNEVYTFVNLGRSESTSESTKCYLRNNNNNGWACYGSTTGNDITLYKAGFTPAAALTSIEIDATSDVLTKEYIQGATFSTIGLKVLGNYSNQTQAEITSGITWTIEPQTLNVTGDNISVTVTAHAKGFDSESRVITGIKVSEPAQEHVYGFFNFMNNGPDITDWNETNAWTSSYTKAHDVEAPEATVHFEGAAKQTTTITNMPVVKTAAIVLELTEEDKQITSVILATAKWGSKSKKITAAVSLDGENYTDLEVEGNETDGLSTAITQNGIRYVKFIPENNDNQLGIATLTFTIADIQYDYFRNDLVVGNYGTVCVPYEVKATDRSGATFWNIETSNTPGYTNPTSVTIVQYEGDLVAGKPYIFCATSNTMSMFFSGDKYEESESVPANGLYGNLTEETITINDQNDPNAGPEPTRGFFFVLQQKLYECGWNCTVAPNRGWVQAAAIEDKTTPSPAPRRVIGNPNGTPTGINNLNVDGWVDLQGAHKYLYNNHIMIVNEGRIYNAQGIRIQ